MERRKKGLQECLQIDERVEQAVANLCPLGDQRKQDDCNHTKRR